MTPLTRACLGHSLSKLKRRSQDVIVQDPEQAPTIEIISKKRIRVLKLHDILRPARPDHEAL